MHIYNEIDDESTKNKLVTAIVFLKSFVDTAKIIHTSKYFHMKSITDRSIIKISNQILNILCTFISVDITKKLEISNDPNEIYRYMKISKNISIYELLYMYTSDCCRGVEVFPNVYFRRHHIMNLDFIDPNLLLKLCVSDGCSIQIHNIVKDNGLSSDLSHNIAYKNEIYGTRLLNKVKAIRKLVYGELEDDISYTMIPIVYKEKGLFWHPAKYPHN